MVYVDDLIILGSDLSLIDSILWQLDSKFSTKDLGVLSYFCGVEVLTNSMGLLLSQHKYVIDLLSKHNMLNSKPVSTSLVMGTSLTANDGTTGQCQHISLGGWWPPTSSNDSAEYFLSENKLSHFMHMPSKHHCGVVKCLLRYLNGTRSLGI